LKSSHPLVSRVITDEVY